VRDAKGGGLQGRRHCPEAERSETSAARGLPKRSGARSSPTRAEGEGHAQGIKKNIRIEPKKIYYQIITKMPG
jgi:hypothetical protein